MAVSRSKTSAEPDANVVVPAALPDSGVRFLIERMIAEQRLIVESLERLNQTVEAHLAVQDRASSGGVATNGLHAPQATPPSASVPTVQRITVQCLGPFRLLMEGAPIEQWPPGRARALFQYLVTRRNRPIARETLIEALWPNPDALAASTSLKVAVHALRQLLGQPLSAGPGLAILARGSGYELATDEVWLDVDEFERACTRGRRLEAEGRGAEAALEYARATELYKGDFLEESSDEWVLLRREGLKDQYLLALARLADVALAEQDYSGCVERCQQLLEHDRCREDAYRTLMLCHARLGQRGRVQRWYELCVRTLRADLDVEPEPETEALYRRAIAGQFSPLSVHHERPRLTAG